MIFVNGKSAVIGSRGTLLGEDSKCDIDEFCGEGGVGITFELIIVLF